MLNSSFILSDPIAIVPDVHPYAIISISSDGKIIKGKIGKDLSLEDGQKASKLCVVNILAQVKKAMDGNLDNVKNCIKITGFVNSSDDFIDQPKVINPASETLSFDRIETTISSNFSHMEFTRFDLILIALSLTWLLEDQYV